MFKDLGLDGMGYEWVSDEEKGRRLIATSMARVDESWVTLRRTTLAILAVTVASSNEGQRELAKEMVLSMLGLANKMCKGWGADNGGITMEPVDRQELLTHADETDRLGQELGKEARGLQVGILMNLTSQLAMEWGNHIKLVTTILASFSKVLSGDDMEWVGRLVVEEQAKLMDGLLAEAQEVLEDGSEDMVRTLQWVEAASGVYDAAEGFGHKAAMQAVISSMAFPRVGKVVLDD